MKIYLNKGKLKYSNIFIFTIIFLNSQIFSYSVNNPFGIKGFSEAFSLLLFFYALYFFYDNAFRVDKLDFLAFITPISLIVMSAFLAKVHYGQPILAGIIEERRMLGLYVYFPLIRHFRYVKNDIDKLYFYIFISTFIAIILGLLYQLDIVKGFNVTSSSLRQFRQDRATTGNHYVVLSCIILYCYLIFKVEKRVKHAFFLAVCFTTLLTISQSRGIVIALVLVILLTNRSSKHVTYKFSYLGLSLASFLLVAISLDIKIPFLETVIQPFIEISSESYINDSVRAQTIAKIVSDMSFFGHGALWLQWNNGFVPYYGEYFFLSDVGIWGTLFRYGIFSVIPISIYAFFAKQILIKPNSNLDSLIAFGIFLHVTLMIPIAGAFEYRSFIIAIAIVVYKVSKLKKIRYCSKVS